MANAAKLPDPVFRLVGTDHPITLGNLPANVRKSLTLHSASQFTVLAERGPKLVGFFRYEFDDRGTFVAAGTWVSPEERKAGLGAALWNYALKRVRPRRVWVKTVSEGGQSLVSRMMRESGKIHWTVVCTTKH